MPLKTRLELCSDGVLRVFRRKKSGLRTSVFSLQEYFSITVLVPKEARGKLYSIDFVPVKKKKVDS